MGTIAILQMMELVDSKRVAGNLSASSSSSPATARPPFTQTHASRAEKLDAAVWAGVFACLDHRTLLCGVERVCARFQRASATGAGWHNRTLHRFADERRRLFPEMVAALGPRLRALTSISVHYPPNENRSRPFAERHMTRLETLRVDVDGHFPLVAYVAQLPRTLTRLEVVGMKLELSSDHLLALVGARPSLQSLQLDVVNAAPSDTHRYRTALLARVGSSSSSETGTGDTLTRLHVRSSGTVSGALWRLVAHLPRLRHLELACSVYSLDPCRFDWTAPYDDQVPGDSSHRYVPAPMPSLETLAVGIALHPTSLRAICRLQTLRLLRLGPGFRVLEPVAAHQVRTSAWGLSTSTSLEALETDVALDGFTWRLPPSLRRFAARVILQSSGVDSSLAQLTELELPYNMTLSPLLEKTLSPDCVRKRYRIPVAPTAP